MSKIIGIDLGTTNSCVSVLEGGEPTVITNPEGGRTTPSVVAFVKDGERLIGQAAKRQAVTNPENTVFSIKRFMGRMFKEVDNEISEVPYKVEKNSNGAVNINANGKDYTPPEISAMILQKLKQDAEEYLGSKVTDAVITVPAYFNDSQRQATKDAGKIAGLNVRRIINEPTAASLAYGLDKKKDEKIAVFDLGGGTFDVSIIKVNGQEVDTLASCGVNRLGGDDFDKALFEIVASKYKQQTGNNLSREDFSLNDAEEYKKLEKPITFSGQVKVSLPTNIPEGNDKQWFLAFPPDGDYELYLLNPYKKPEPKKQTFEVKASCSKCEVLFLTSTYGVV